MASNSYRTMLLRLVVALLLSLLVGSASLSAQATTVLLVRHSEKADTSADPNLSVSGLARAQDLSQLLATFPLSAIYVSEYRRTDQTARPTATKQKLSPVAIPVAGDPVRQAKAVHRAISQLQRGSAVLVVGHSNTIPALLAELGGPSISNLCDNDYSSIFLLQLPEQSGSARLLHLHFGPANPPATDLCTADFAE